MSIALRLAFCFLGHQFPALRRCILLKAKDCKSDAVRTADCLSKYLPTPLQSFAGSPLGHVPLAIPLLSALHPLLPRVPVGSVIRQPAFGSQLQNWLAHLATYPLLLAQSLQKSHASSFARDIPNAKVRMYLVCPKYWTLTLMSLMVYPSVLQYYCIPSELKHKREDLAEAGA